MIHRLGLESLGSRAYQVPPFHMATIEATGTSLFELEELAEIDEILEALEIAELDDDYS
jgi:hypothetical protein